MSAGTEIFQKRFLEKLPVGGAGMARVFQMFRDLINSEEGATAVEYAIMAGFIAAVIAGAVGGLGQAVVGLFERVPPF